MLDIKFRQCYNYSYMRSKIDGKDLFQVVLDDDEEVVQVLRPLKSRAWFGVICGFIILSLIMIPLGICMIVFNDPGSEEGETIGVGIVCLVLWLLVSAFSLISVGLWTHKTLYALTNKRVLIRTGYIGVDYKSLDLTTVGALSVNVTMIDKIMRKNTGTIAFGSMSSPMTTQNASKFNFALVYDPYHVYKEVKAYIDQKKSEAAAK